MILLCPHQRQEGVGKAAEFLGGGPGSCCAGQSGPAPPPHGLQLRGFRGADPQAKGPSRSTRRSPNDPDASPLSRTPLWV